MSDNQKKLNEQLLNVILSENSSDEVKLKRVKYLVRLGADVNYQIYGKSLLCHAIRAKVFDEVIGFLEESGAREWKISKADAKALGNEIKNCYDLNEIIELLKQGADVDSVDNMGRCLLERGIVKGDKQLVEIVIKQGGNLNIKNSWGNTPLICAVDENKLEIAKLLLDGGADVDQKGRNSNTPLMKAIDNNNAKMVKMLLEAKADVNLKQDTFRMSPLRNAISRPDTDIEIIKLLLEGGADIEEDCGYNGKVTPLVKAIDYNRVEIVKLLIEKGVDVNKQNKFGTSDLMTAICSDKVEIAKMLIDADIDLNVSNDDGDTALILAVKRGHKKIVKMLIEKGADLNKQNNDGFTALVLASISDKKNDLVKMLVDSGADVNVKGDGGWTALMWAAYNGSKDMVQMLLEKGADVNIKNNYGNRVWDGCDREIVNVIKEHIKKTGGEPTNGGFLGKIFGGFGR